MANQPIRAELPAHDDDTDNTHQDSELPVQRIEINVTPAMYIQLECAAALSNQTMDAFIIEAARRAVAEAMQPRQVITLNAEQSRIVADLLLNPPDPPPALVEVMREYDERSAAQKAARSARDTWRN